MCGDSSFVRFYLECKKWNEILWWELQLCRDKLKICNVKFNSVKWYWNPVGSQTWNLLCKLDFCVKKWASVASVNDPRTQKKIYTRSKEVWPWKVILCRSNKPSPKCKFENCDYKWWPLYIVLHVTCIYMKKICKNETVMLLNDTENKLWFVFLMILFNHAPFFNYTCGTKK